MDAVSERARRGMTIAVIVLAVLTLVGVVAVWPTEGAADPGPEPLEATITDVTVGPCAAAIENPGRCRVVAFDLDDGEQGSFEIPADFAGLEFDTGDDILVNAFPTDRGQVIYTFLEFQRRTPLLVLTFLFVAAILVLGRLKGLGALAGLAASLGVIGFFLLPALLEGNSPVVVALAGSMVVAFVALYLAHGFNAQTTVALLGTAGALLITTVLAVVFVELAGFTGFADEYARVLDVSGVDLNLETLVLAGMVIGALGVLDDVTVTQVSSVWEIRAADPSMSRIDLYRAGLRVGRDHISSTVNTLVLAYAGASLPLLLLFSRSGQPWSVVTNQEIVAVEIVRALVGSIGLVAAVPITTVLAALAAAAAAPRRDDERRAGAW